MGKITISQFLTVMQFPNSFLEGIPGFDHRSRISCCAKTEGESDLTPCKLDLMPGQQWDLISCYPKCTTCSTCQGRKGEIYPQICSAQVFLWTKILDGHRSARLMSCLPFVVPCRVSRLYWYVSWNIVFSLPSNLSMLFEKVTVC